MIFSSSEHSSSELMPWCSVRRPSIRPSTFHISNFFSRKAEGIYSKLATNVPYEVLTNSCYFLSRSKIQYGCTGLWLADTFWTSSQERLKGSTPNATNVPYEVPTKCCYFLSESEIQYGRSGLLLADTFWTSSQERLKGSTPNLPQMFLMRSQPSVVNF